MKLFAVQICHLQVLGCLGAQLLRAGASLQQPATADNHPAFAAIHIAAHQVVHKWHLALSSIKVT